MRVVPLLLLLCFVGCGDQSTTTTEPADQSLDANSITDEITPPGDISVGGVALESKTLLDGRLSLLIPKDFEIMDEEMLRAKYPSERRPTLVYTNEVGSVNVAINHTSTRIQQSQLADFHTHLDAAFRNMYPSATWFESGVVSVNGRDWVTLDVRTPAMDTKIRNIMMVTSLEGRQLMVTVNVIQELEEAWLEPAKAIAQSLQVTD